MAGEARQDEQQGVVFGADADGSRSTSAVGRSRRRRRAEVGRPDGGAGRRGRVELALGLPPALPPAGRGRSGLAAGARRHRARRAGLAGRPDAGRWRGRGPAAGRLARVGARSSTASRSSATATRSRSWCCPTAASGSAARASAGASRSGSRRGIVEPSVGGGDRPGPRQPRVAAPRGPHRRGARRRLGDGAAAVADALGRARRRGRPRPPGDLEAGPHPGQGGRRDPARSRAGGTRRRPGRGGRRRPADRGAGRRAVAAPAPRPARARQLRLRRRWHQPAPLGGRRRADHQAAGRR